MDGGRYPRRSCPSNVETTRIDRMIERARGGSTPVLSA
jgi:hypothetical protein